MGVSITILNANCLLRAATQSSARANSNSVPAAFWFLYEVFSDPVLLARARKDVDSAHLPSINSNDPPRFDINLLCKAPLLQSVYAEVLRLRTAIFITRMPEHNDFRLGDWIFPKNKLMMAASYTAHHDESVWNTGTATDPHPL